MKRYIRSSYDSSKRNIYWPNGMQVTDDEMIDVLMWYYGEDAKAAEHDLDILEDDELERAVRYYVDKVDGRF